MDLSGAFIQRIYTSDGVPIDDDILEQYGYRQYFDLSGCSCLTNQIPESQPASAVSDNESESESESEREDQQRQEYHDRLQERMESRPVSSMLDQIVEEQNKRRSSLITREALLYWSVHITNMVWTAVSWAAYYTKKAVVGAYDGVVDNQYYFFQSSTVPYQSSKVNLSAPGAAQVEWTYQKDTQLFTKSEHDGQAHHLPYLTAGIWHEGLLLYTITDFVEECKYRGNVPPTPHHILAAWFLKTGILLDPSLPFVMKVITEEGEEKELALQPRVSQ